MAQEYVDVRELIPEDPDLEQLSAIEAGSPAAISIATPTQTSASRRGAYRRRPRAALSLCVARVVPHLVPVWFPL